MYTRDKQFYDIVAKGLASMGYVSDKQGSALTKYINDMFAENTMQTERSHRWVSL